MRPVFIPAAPGCAKSDFRAFRVFRDLKGPERAIFTALVMSRMPRLDSLAGRRQLFILQPVQEERNETPARKESYSLSRRPFLLHYFPMLNYPICGGV